MASASSARKALADRRAKKPVKRTPVKKKATKKTAKKAVKKTPAKKPGLRKSPRKKAPVKKRAPVKKKATKRTPRKSTLGAGKPPASKGARRMPATGVPTAAKILAEAEKKKKGKSNPARHAAEFIDALELTSDATVRQAILDSVPDEVKPFMPDHFKKTGDTWNAAGANPTANTGTATTDADVKVHAKGKDYRIVVKPDSNRPVIQEDDGDGGWEDEGHTFKDVEEADAYLNACDGTDAACERKIAGKKPGKKGGFSFGNYGRNR